MLKLKRVELQGFKSFCDRTELKFNGGGITAVVGPNGCGKSNLSDAISWVLGEQSAKSLRGARMEDVIFAGTRERKSVGLASVTMTLVEPPNGKPHAVETTVTRRLYRSGESEYLINGHIARLRDIQDIFMGTGLGPESYAIIEQGRIGQILSSRPQDRRAIIEEAAGVTRYKTKRRLAEAKLEGAKQNLARVFDILEEVTRQVNSLKRQAAKARRYGELKTEMESRLAALLSGKFRVLERDAAKCALDLNVAAADARALAESVAARESAHAALQGQTYEVEQSLTAARARVAELNVEAERTRGRLEAQVKEVAVIESRIAAREKEAAELDLRLAELGAESDGHRGRLAELDAAIAGVRERLAAKNAEREELAGRLREREKGIESGRQAVLRLLGEASTLKNQLTQIDSYLAGIDRESARASREEETATAELERLGATRKALSETMAQRQMELESVAGERRRTEEELTAQRLASGELRKLVDGLRSETSKLQARKQSLEEVLAHRTYTTESVKRLFAASVDGFRPLGVLADFVEVDPAFEKCVEEFLHEELEYVVVQNWEHADSGVDFLRRDLEGRATFLVHPEPASNGKMRLPEPTIGPATGIVARLTDALKLTNGLKDRAADLLPRVSLCFVAEDRESARRLAVAYPHLYFLLQDGLCYHGQTLTGGKKTASGPLALKREAREVGLALGEKMAELESAAARAEELGREIGLLESELERLRGSQQAREKDRLALEHEMRKVAEDTNRANSRLSVARLELERLRMDREKSIEQRVAGQAALEEREAQRLAREEALELERVELESLEAAAAALSEEHAVLRAELAGLEERSRGERSALGRLEAQVAETSGRRGEIAPEVARLGEERARLLGDNIELDHRGAEIAAQLGEGEAEVNRLALAEAEMRESLRLGEEELRAMRVAVAEASERRAAIEVELVKRQAELGYLDETSRKELGVEVASLAASAGDVLPDGEALAEMERLYLEVKNRIEALGPVNADALAEYQETQQRHDFLSVQRQDLLDSIRDTEKAIQEIDVVSRTKFEEAFEAINANFREGFSTLFGGGTGEMRLTDEANVAESGIDIVASPPGKKLQNVLLLSGGEKALAAVALLMAIFKYQPSPFCILDEVDAPLDEANIDRLTRLLREMSTTTQFIVITHSKKTMESAGALYGVTMQEPGVSKLVSVRLNGGAVSEARA